MVDSTAGHDNTTNLSKLYDLTDHTEQIWFCAFNRTGTLLGTTGTDKSIKLYQFNTTEQKYQLVNEILQQHTRTIRSLSFHPTSRLLASGSFDSEINIYKYNTDTSQYELQHNLDGHENEIKCVAYNMSGELLASCSRDKSIWIWSLTNDSINDEYECMSVLNGHTADVKYVAWLDNNALISASYDNTIRIWRDDVDTDDFICSQILGTADTNSNDKVDDTDQLVNQKNDIIGHTSTVWCVAVNPNNSNQFISCSDDCTLILWSRTDATSQFNQSIKLSNLHTRTIYSCDWNTDNYIVTVGADNQIILYKYTEINNKSTVTVQCRLPNAHKNDINCVKFKPDSNMICTVSDDIVVSLWKYETITSSNM